MTTNIRKLSLVGVWLIFAVLTLYAGNNPGYVRHPELTPYPWRGVGITWMILAAQAWLLFALLRPKPPGGWRARLWPTTGWLALQAIVAAGISVTDMPGYHYVPGFFAATTLLVLLTAATGHSILAWLER